MKVNDYINKNALQSSENKNASSIQKKQADLRDCQLTWESQWEEWGPKQTHVFVLGELPFFEEIARDRIQRYKIPMLQRFCLSPRQTEALPGFRVADQSAFEGLGEQDRLEIVGPFAEEGLLLLLRFQEKWNYECWTPSALASHLKHAGLSRIGTLYLIAPKLGIGEFLPSLARELTGRGIQYHVLCGPEGIMRPRRDSIVKLPQQIRVIEDEKTFSLPVQSNSIATLGPMLREGGTDFDYEIIVHAGENPAVAEAAGILVGSSPFRTCWVKWNPSRGDWQVLYGEPRFLRWSTRWAVVAQSENCLQRGDLFAGLSTTSFAIRFLRLLHSFEAWQEIHGKLSHLLLVGANLFQSEKKVAGGFALRLAQEFAALRRRIQIRVREFVQQKDISGLLHAGQLTNESSCLKWTSASLIWERDLNWNMGDLIAIDAPVYEPEAPFRKPSWSPSLVWRSSLGVDLAWISGCSTARRWRERLRVALTEVSYEGISSGSHPLIPILEIAALRDEPQLLGMDISRGEALPMGACSSCLREFENYFQVLAENLFQAFLVDGDLRLQKRVGISPQIYDKALHAALSLLCLTHSEKEDAMNSFQIALAVRLCSEFLKNLGEKSLSKAGILVRAWRAVSRDYENIRLSLIQQQRAAWAALSLTEAPDEYEIARAYQFSAYCIQTSPSSLCWQDFLDPLPTPARLLGNACELLTAPGLSPSRDSLPQSNQAEEYFEKIHEAQKNAVGSFQNTPEGVFWTPPAFAVILQVDLRTSWLGFGTHLLYSSRHEGKAEVTEGGMPFVQVEHAARLPFPVWSRIFAIDLWQVLGGDSREPLPMKPEIVVLPITPTTCISYEWSPCDSEPRFLPDGALKKIAKTGRFHPLYREFDQWHAVQKLDFEASLTKIEVFLDFSTKLLIFPDAGSPPKISYRFYGAGGTYRCLVRPGFSAEIECANRSESWTFESAEKGALKVTENRVEGEGILIQFTGISPRKLFIGTHEPSKAIDQISLIETIPDPLLNSRNLPGFSLGIVGDLHVRFDPSVHSLQTFCSRSFIPLGPLKTIYAQTTHRFDRVGIHDGCCFAVEYLLSLCGSSLEFTYRLSSVGWTLAIVSTDIHSFFTELKTARKIKCPLDEFLLRWLDTETILGIDEREEDGILPQLAEVVLVCPKSKISLFPLWVRTSDNSVIWKGKCPSKGNAQIGLASFLGEEMKFLFQCGGQTYLKNGWDNRMFPIGDENQLKHLIHSKRWTIFLSAIYSLAMLPLHIGWRVTDSVSEAEFRDLLFRLGDQLRHPMLGLVIESSSACSRTIVFLDPVGKVAFPSPIQEIENEGWFLGRENYGGFACWWLPQDHRVVCSSPLPIPNVWNDPIDASKAPQPKKSYELPLGIEWIKKCFLKENPVPGQNGMIRAPFSETVSGAGIADGFLHLRANKGDIYRRLTSGSWQMIQAFCSGDSVGEIFCEIAHAIPQIDFLILPLQIKDSKGARRVGWFLSQTSQIVKAPPEAGSEAILLGGSVDGKYHYIFGENTIFEVNGSSCECQGRASFALRKNGVLFLIVYYVANPPILDAEKLILIGSSQCTRWTLGEGLRSYRLIVVESSHGAAISGVLDLQPLCIQDCGCWIDGEDFVIAELATGNRLVIQDGASVLSPGYLFGKIQIRLSESENYLSLQNLLDTCGK